MRALQVTELTGPDAVQVNYDAPEPGTGSGVLIDVHAGGLAFADLLLTHGKYQANPDLPFTLAGRSPAPWPWRPRARDSSRARK